MPEPDDRGKIEALTADANGAVAMDEVEILQNLEQDDSIIGKALVLYEKDDSVPIMCCAIGVGLPDGGLPPVV